MQSAENLGLVEIRPERPDDFPAIREIIAATMRTRLPISLTSFGIARTTSPNSAGWRSLPPMKSSAT